MTTKLHILSLNWNGQEELKWLFPKLKNNIDNILLNTNIESIWYIKDNGSSDKSVNLAKSFNDFGLNTNVYQIGHNTDNFSKGVNYLFNKAKPNNDDLILLLNNDIMFDDDVSLMKMINLLKPEVGIVGCKLKYPGTNKLQHAGVIFSDQYGSMPYHFRHKEIGDEFSNKNRYFQAVTGACCLFKASDFIAVEGFNELLYWSFEDIDFNLKIGQKKKIVYCGETNIFHKESFSLAKNPVNKMFLQSNVNIFKKTWFGKYEIDHQKYINNPDYNVIV